MFRLRIQSSLYVQPVRRHYIYIYIAFTHLLTLIARRAANLNNAIRFHSLTPLMNTSAIASSPLRILFRYRFGRDRRARRRTLLKSANEFDKLNSIERLRSAQRNSRTRLFRKQRNASETTTGETYYYYY